MKGLLPQRKNPFYILTSPYIITVWMYLPIFLIYLIISPTLFKAWYNEPKVLSNFWQAAYFLSIIILFGIGGYLGSHLLPRTKSRQRVSAALVPRWYTRSGIIVSIVAYLIWFGLGIRRAGGIEKIFSFYLINPSYVKSVLLRTVPGITTFTQIAVAAIPLMICYGRLARIDHMLIGTVFLLATLRAFLFSERLALLELLVPVSFLILSARKIKWGKALRYLLVFIVFVLTFFILNESRRSFVYKGWNSIGDLAEAGSIRFLGYYVTSVNNALFFADKFAFATPLYNTLQFIWRFPGLQDVYVKFAEIHPIHAPELLYQYGMNPEFNTATAIGAWIIGFGLFGAFIVTFFFAFFSGVLYRLASRNKFAAALYSVWLVGLLEFMRIEYFTTTRLSPAYLFFVGALLLISLRPKGVT